MTLSSGSQVAKIGDPAIQWGEMNFVYTGVDSNYGCPQWAMGLKLVGIMDSEF